MDDAFENGLGVGTRIGLGFGFVLIAIVVVCCFVGALEIGHWIWRLA